MIRVTRLGGKTLYLNSDLIEAIESAPDTTLLLTTGKRVIVREGADEVVRRVVAFRRHIAGRPLAPAAAPADLSGATDPTATTDTTDRSNGGGHHG